MAEKQVTGIFKFTLSFAAVLFLLSGCMGPQPQPKKGILDDVSVFRDLQQFDLDNDGRKEIIAIYATSANSTGVKVIKFQGDKGEVAFERVFDTPNVTFVVKKKPVLVVRKKGPAAGCSSKKSKTLYMWDGKTFVSKKKSR